MLAVLDTNVVVDYLNGVELARQEFHRYDRLSLSVVTWMEVLVAARDADDARRLRRFLAGFDIAPLSSPVAELAVKLRKEHRLRLPDAVIWATALVHERMFVTRNTRDFPRDHRSIRVPYEL